VACKAAGISRTTAYEHRERDPAFAEAWNDALNQSLDVLEHEVYQRAIKGDAQLAMFILKAHRPRSIARRSGMKSVCLAGLSFRRKKGRGSVIHNSLGDDRTVLGAEPLTRLKDANIA
jgi:hypothetical protein